MTLALYLLAVPAAALAYYKWLRVAQREHYIPGRIRTISLLWARTLPVNAALWIVGLALLVAGAFWPYLLFAVYAVAALWPMGMSITAQSKKLVFTPRLTRLAISVGVVFGLVLWLAGPIGGAAAVLLSPLVLDAALWVMRPIEAMLASRYVRSAEAKIRAVRPTIVAITGSYGKTSTKHYTAHLIGGYRSTLATPASFNNLLGISRTVNDRLTPGIEVFIAEMGTYGKGEIRQLCRHYPPRIAAITTIGEAHLERMRTRGEIAEAKSEILEPAETAVLNIDVPELAAIAEQVAAQGKRVIRCSTTAGASADVTVVCGEDGKAVATIDAVEIATLAVPATAHAANIAVAIGLAHALGIPPRRIGAGLTNLPDVEHRAVVRTLPTGVVVIDDTYNSNPSGAQRAVSAAAQIRAKQGMHLWVITPGMIELGGMQSQRNRELASQVAGDAAATLAIVGHTNRTALVDGTRGTGRDPLVFSTRTRASDAVFAQAKPGDVVLFENDLPDHYP